jgi:hypothetical protein
MQKHVSPIPKEKISSSISVDVMDQPTSDAEHAARYGTLSGGKGVAPIG